MITPCLFRILLKIYAKEVVRAVYSGILSRDADEGGLESYSREIASNQDLAAILSKISASRESWQLHLYDHPDEIVRLIFIALLDREPDVAALDSYRSALTQGRDITSVLSEIAHSSEFRKMVFAAPKHDLVHAIYRGLLGRQADPEGLGNYASKLTTLNDLSAIMSSILSSDEFTRLHTNNVEWPDPALSYDQETVINLHIQKTGGTTIQRMLIESFGQECIYHEHSDTLYQRSPGELSRYSVFSGHFNMDSLDYIPRRKLSIFTFVREPKKRLLSLYYFWRAHEPTHRSYHIGMKLANHLPIEDFVKKEEMMQSPDVWNHMSWAIMGRRKWQSWQKRLSALGDEDNQHEILLNVVRPAVRTRLREFIFVGIQEDFSRSIDCLFKILKRPKPELRTEHSLEKLMQNDFHFKKSIEKQPYTTVVDAALDKLVQLDNIVYEEALALYSERLENEEKARAFHTTVTTEPLQSD